ncbi:EAL domain-containing protein [Deinococcus sp. Arct2-2]|uniref:putative bifunctional diguanylate cyclase/phosphodiesterase n=1 Tax=Deinococcus sp. Arct2-2 TaxID=2568653 RepID=UPI0010A2D617|nr:EAL domain-containing protein [Deinococcus sp. Arct2-2]THF68857.1 EAL domain-containing protein [Deinococcus sp. Arct2-2]
MRTGRATKDASHRALEDALQEVTTILESITDALFALDHEWRFTRVNASAERLLKRSRESLIGRVVWEEFPAALDSIFEREYRRAVTENVAVAFEAYYEPLKAWREVRAYPSAVGLSVYLHDITEKRALLEELRYQAHHDSLTALPNRTLFEDRLELAITRARRSGRRVAVGFLDLDDFKTVNDSLGHHTGDLLLREAAGRLQALMRKGDTLSRRGGDEFLFIADDLLTPEDGVRVGQRLLQALADPFEIAGHSLHVTACIGLSVFPEDGEDTETLKSNADAAMYRAKAKGRGLIACFEPVMGEAAAERLRLESDLRRALERGELHLVYQPLFDAVTRELVSAEALLRWRHPVLGPVPPGRFIPVAEASGMMVGIGAWVLREACRQAGEWARSPAGPLRVAVNVSAMQFSRADFLDEVVRALEDSGLEPHLLELELTESLVMADVVETRRQLVLLRSLGVGVAVDDFGTGYSSLAHLQNLPLDTLKIDKSFVNRLEATPSSLALVRAVVNLGRDLEMRVVAEGVESEAQLETLRGLGCHHIQGYLLAKPLPPEDLVRLRANWSDSSLA